MEGMTDNRNHLRERHIYAAWQEATHDAMHNASL